MKGLSGKQTHKEQELSFLHRAHVDSHLCARVCVLLYEQIKQKLSSAAPQEKHTQQKVTQNIHT